MFANAGLFGEIPCPERANCTRPACLFSHSPHLPPPRTLTFTRTPAPAPAPAPVIPAKRPAALSSPEPPRKVQKRVPQPQRPLSVPSSSSSSSSTSSAAPPVLRINAAQSLVAIPVRQTMLKTLYDHFLVLYAPLLSSNPSLASDHALKQEDEVYRKSTKLTYRNAVIQCVAALKRRESPTSINHPSVGTDSEIAARVQAQKALRSLHLDRDALDRLVHSPDDLRSSGYFMDIPSLPGGTEPSMEGKMAKCDRCAQYFLVEREQDSDKCTYHWGKPYSARVDGAKIRLYTCCSRPVADGGGCSNGPHVFYESTIDDLHSRHSFTSLSSVVNPGNSKHHAVALDCEMIYTTGGMRVARVSIVDASGKQIYDEFVQMDDDVHVIDYNTRFSGVNKENHATARSTLSSIRASMDSFLNSNTILIGHALDNDLKTLRIIHHKCIDTALLFPHRAGLPYRRSLKDLVREKLGKLIQTGGATEGHSSVEDASSTLDLVRWYILNTQKSAIHMS